MENITTKMDKHHVKTVLPDGIQPGRIGVVLVVRVSMVQKLAWSIRAHYVKIVQTDIILTLAHQHVTCAQQGIIQIQTIMSILDLKAAQFAQRDIIWAAPDQAPAPVVRQGGLVLLQEIRMRVRAITVVLDDIKTKQEELPAKPVREDGDKTLTHTVYLHALPAQRGNIYMHLELLNGHVKRAQLDIKVALDRRVVVPAHKGILNLTPDRVVVTVALATHTNPIRARHFVDFAYIMEGRNVARIAINYKYRTICHKDVGYSRVVTLRHWRSRNDSHGKFLGSRAGHRRVLGGLRDAHHNAILCTRNLTRGLTRTSSQRTDSTSRTRRTQRRSART